MSSVNLLASLQQVQSTIATMFPNGSTPSTASDQATLASFQQILASLSPTTGAAGGVMGLTASSDSGAATGSTGSTGASDSGAVTGSDVVADAEKYLGVPYVLDGESTQGIDCSGLVQKTYGDLGITLPRTVHEQKLMGTAVPSLAQAQPGDLIVFKGGGHVAIYEGNNTVIHAPYPGRVVSNEKLWVGDSGIETIRRIVPAAGTSAPTSSPTTSSTTPTSASVQAAALATVQAMIQADYGLLSGASSSTAPGMPGTTDSSSSLSSAIAALEGSTTGTSSTTSTATTSSSTAAQQALAAEQAMLAQEQL